MHKTIETLCEALDQLGKTTLSSSPDNRTLFEIYGNINFPPLNRHDLADLAFSISQQLRNANPEQIDKKLDETLSDIPRKLQLLYPSTIPNIFVGNAVSAYTAYLATITWVQTVIQPLLGWQSITDSKLLPPRLATRLRGVQAGLDSLIPDFDNLSNQIKTIQDATAAADSLPTDLETLQLARQKIATLETQSSELKVKIELSETSTKEAAEKIAKRKEEADKLIEQCEMAYRITTSKGLAGAFDQRANSLTMSIYGWIAGLIIALSLSVWIGTARYAILVAKLNEVTPSWGVISIHICLSVLALAAPVWFAWLATKQISQRFKLSEDYAYKASIAKAYEGYRREAASIDEQFVARLFGSTLTRLEEAPLRLMNEAEHRSPIQELLASKGFQKALETVPELRESFANFFKETMATVTTGIGNVLSKNKNDNSKDDA